jgi:hypothetical protein
LRILRDIVLDIKYLIIVSQKHILYINKINLYILKTLSLNESRLFWKVIIYSILIIILFNPVILLSLEAIILLFNTSKVSIPIGVAKLNIYLSKYIKGIISGYYKVVLVVLISLPVKLLAITIIIKLVILTGFKLDFIIFLAIYLEMGIIKKIL